MIAQVPAKVTYSTSKESGLVLLDKGCEVDPWINNIFAEASTLKKPAQTGMTSAPGLSTLTVVHDLKEDISRGNNILANSVLKMFLENQRVVNRRNAICAELEMITGLLKSTGLNSASGSYEQNSRTLKIVGKLIAQAMKRLPLFQKVSILFYKNRKENCRDVLFFLYFLEFSYLGSKRKYFVMWQLLLSYSSPFVIEQHSSRETAPRVLKGSTTFFEGLCNREYCLQYASSFYLETESNLVTEGL